MTTLRTILGVAPVMMLALLPASGFEIMLRFIPDYVTWEKCETPGFYQGRRILTPQDVNATILNIFECETSLTEIKSNDFNGLPNLAQIFLQNNDITRVDPSAFQTVPNLMTLDLSNNKLREPPLFEYSFRLLVLNLRSNKITGLHNPRTFSACAGLYTLDLSGNLIEYIHPEIFRPLTVLSELHLNNNKIAFIPSNLFISNLWMLYLHGNRFAFLPADFVSGLNNAHDLDLLSLYNNPWKCECLLEVLAEIRIQRGRHLLIGYLGDPIKCIFNGMKPCYRATPALMK